MRVYIAGPYTLGDHEANVRNMIDAADRLMIAGHTPFVPLLNHYWHKIHQHRESEWLRQDLEWMKQCEAFIRLPGESSGADIEEMFARVLADSDTEDFRYVFTGKSAVDDFFNFFSDLEET